MIVIVLEEKIWLTITSQSFFRYPLHEFAPTLVLTIFQVFRLTFDFRCKFAACSNPPDRLTKIIIVKRNIQGRNYMTRARVEPNLDHVI